MKIFFSGIGGIGLSAYASLRRAEGHDVGGSDTNDSALLDDLRSHGIAVSLDQSGKAIPPDTNLFVYSEAIPEDAPERRRAAELGIRQISYPQAVGELSAGSRLIAVCGTHGKSSTTAMATRLLLTEGMDPTVVIGTKVPELQGKNWRKGKSDLFVLEACEYRHSFHNYQPTIILLTTADGDHFDFYRSAEDYQRSFVTFIRKLPEDGTLITRLIDPDCRAIAEASGRTVIDASDLPLIPLQTPGVHMRQNAQLVLALASVLGIAESHAIAALSGYAGSWRRMEYKGTLRRAQRDNVDDIPVIDDYAHHPREIRATLQGLREQYPKRRIVCVFQPHTHDRTLKLYDEFANAFTGAGVVILCGVYDARPDKDAERVDEEKLSADIARRSTVEVINAGSLQKAEQLIPRILQPGDLLVTMGAGDVTQLADVMVSSANHDGRPSQSSG